MTVEPRARTNGTASEIAALRRELTLIWDGHQREHLAHDQAHTREHEFAQKAIDTAAMLAKENKADANEWRETMNDRERTLATKVDVSTLSEKIEVLQDAEIRRAETERQRFIQESKDKQAAQDRISRSQWTIGIAVLLASFGINLVLRLAGV